MADIFISYLREDIEAAERLAEALAAHGWSVFWDRRRPAGKRFDDFLDEQLQAAHCVIVLWSRRSIHSPWVKDEAAVGRDRGILVPARLDDVLAPFGFRNIQAADLVGWQGDTSDGASSNSYGMSVPPSKCRPESFSGAWASPLRE